MVDFTNQYVTKDFFEKTIKIIAENTSYSYSTIALRGIKEKLSGEFKFLKNVRIRGRSVEVDKTINNVKKKELRNFFITVIGMIGPNYLKILLAQKLDPRSLMYLEKLGLRFG